jgi:hypothetical protein
MHIRRQVTSADNSVKRVLSTLALAGLLFAILYVGAGWIFVDQWTPPKTVRTLTFLVVNFVVGLFVGKRLPRHGWLYAAVPMLLWTVAYLWAIWDYRRFFWLALDYQCVEGVLAAVPGGWLGGHLAQPKRSDENTELQG